MFELEQRENPIRRWLLPLMLGTFAVFALVIVLLYRAVPFTDFKGQSHQSDEQMIANFQQHKTEFEQLRQMILDDKGFTRIDDDWTEPSDPQTINIKPSRITEYRKLFQLLNIPRGFSATQDKNEIEFIASSQGWIASGSSKSYVYLSTRPESLLNNLNQMSLTDKPFGTGYRHIEGNWYLYFYGD